MQIPKPLFVFLAITKSGDHHYVIAEDFGKAWGVLARERASVAATVEAFQKLNEPNLPPLGVAREVEKV